MRPAAEHTGIRPTFHTEGIYAADGEGVEETENAAVEEERE